MSKSKSVLRPVPKKKAKTPARETEIIDLLWTNVEAQTLMGQAADQLAAAAQQLTARFNLEFIEALLWITETVCDRYDLPLLVVQSANVEQERMALTSPPPNTF